ncbi:MAG: acyl-CoA dehydrogenase family protein [Proteobacteria bacterium]|nr:acyl-CoA dehydrogenase family protein [Pseudomonadota bacterium]
MDFELTQEQKMLKDSARKLMEREIAPYMAQFPEDQAMTPDQIKTALKKFIPLGYIGGTVPEEYGGAGLDFMTYILLMEEIDPLFFIPIMITGGAAGQIATLGSEEQRRTYLPALLNADKIGCTGITEPNVGSNPSFIETRAVPDGDDWIINGAKMWISNGAFCDICMVLANADPGKGRKGLNYFIVDKEQSPFEQRPIPIIGDEARMPEVGHLTFEDCRIPRSNVIGVPGEGLRETMVIFQQARCLVALNSVIYAQKALDAAVKYAKERTQFGRPIGQFQLIQAMIADMAALTDASRMLTYRAAALVDRGGRMHREASIAKFYATEAAVKVTSMAIQVHGAYGLSTEYPVEKLFRRARVMTIPDGTTQIQKMVVARELLGMSAFA